MGGGGGRSGTTSQRESGGNGGGLLAEQATIHSQDCYVSGLQPQAQFDLRSVLRKCQRCSTVNPMSTISLKMPKWLWDQVEKEARTRRTTKSAVVRDCVRATLSKTNRGRAASCADLAGELVGSQPGPRDASTNRAHLKAALLKSSDRA